MLKAPLQFFEYDKVAWKGKWQRDAFTENLYLAFEKYYTTNPETPFFELIPYGVRFKQYVGAIQIGKTTIEILPKVGKEGNEKVWQNVLLDMLKVCNLLQAKQSNEANLKLKSNSVLELYYELYLNEIELLIRNGLIKKYQSRSGQMKTLKGALQFAQNISKNSIHKERFFTKHNIYTKDHLLHQILFEALKVIALLSSSELLKDRIGRLKTLFPEVKNLNVKEFHFTKIETSRKHIPYLKALTIAKLILLNYKPDIKGGRENLLAIMFDMNALWEEYIFRILKKEHSKEFQILSQNKKLFWGTNQKIKPDIVMFHRENKKVYVLDTKWKVLKNKRPSDEDLKQMYVYNHHWESHHSILIYPNSSGNINLIGNFALSMLKGEHHCQLLFAKVLEGGRLNKNLSKEIVDYLF